MFRYLGCPTTEVFHPFSAGGTDYDKLRVAIISDQGLVKFYVQDQNSQQIRQQIAFTFYSPSTNPSINYQIEYLVLTAIKGVYLSIDPIFTAIDTDSSQGGMVYIEGVIGSAGISTSQDGYTLWTSWGASTQQDIWTGQTTFQIEISFNQFLNGIRLATAKKLNKSPESVTDADMKDFFGPSYNNPDEWIILGESFSHEIYNPNWINQRAYVGGNMTRFIKTSINF